MHSPLVQTLQAPQIQGIEVRRPCCIHIHSGLVWLTQTRDLTDHFLGTGQTLVLRPGQVLIQAEQNCAFQLQESAGPREPQAPVESQTHPLLGTVETWLTPDKKSGLAISRKPAWILVVDG